jgi:hypothetical protein
MIVRLAYEGSHIIPTIAQVHAPRGGAGGNLENREELNNSSKQIFG